MASNSLAFWTVASIFALLRITASLMPSHLARGRGGRRQYALGRARWFNVLVSLFGGRLRPGKAQRASAGGSAEDDAIITALYQQYSGPLMTFVMRLTAGNRQQAEDVVQETMVRAWRESGRLDLSEPSLMPWLTTVARRIVIDDHRRKQARPIETADTELANLPAEDDTAAADRRLIVAEALLALSPLHRQVLNETILRDRTVNQAAEVLGIPVGTVKSRVYYALRALQVVLAERGVLP